MSSIKILDALTLSLVKLDLEKHKNEDKFEVSSENEFTYLYKLRI